MSKQYKGSLTLEWFNKQKAIINLNENSIKSEKDIPVPRINWINKEEALFYDLNQEEGIGNIPYWVNRDDIRVKEARPLVFQKAFNVISRDIEGTIPGTNNEYIIEEISKDEIVQSIEIVNTLIKGDNLLVLNSLKKQFDKLPENEKVKCIYIDPPYNTGSAFEQYDDNLEHSEWLTLMRDRLYVLKDMLREDGTIWISIDDDECHYLKILCDEIFGRQNFIASNIWQKIHSTKNDAKFISINHEYILCYAKNIEKVEIGLLERTDEMNDRYKNSDNDPKGPWQSGDLVANEERKGGYYDVVSPTGKIHNVPQGKHWVYSKERMMKLIDDGEIWFGKDGNSFPRKKRYLSEVLDGRKTNSWWDSKEVGHNQEAKREVKTIDQDDVFATPKPERLIERILKIASFENDLILDAFAGSGTTLSVAHKMKRRWIGVEIGNHADTHIIPRLKGVILGTDKIGISDKIKWRGGGGFSYYHLGESIINVDKETSKGEFNWKLGKAFIQESLLVSYDFIVQNDINVFPAQIFKDDNNPTIGKVIGKNGKSIYGIAFLVAPGETALTITNEEIKTIYSVIRKQEDFQSLVIYTNKGIDIAQDAIPENLDIIKVPHAIFAELER
jgi:adenine-specific DNA-methyltransferase